MLKFKLKFKIVKILKSRKDLLIQLLERGRFRAWQTWGLSPQSLPPLRAASSRHKTLPSPQLIGPESSSLRLSLTLTGSGSCFSDVAVELPFTLMHPKPKEEPPHREGKQDLQVTGVGVSGLPTPFSSCCLSPSPHFSLG